MKSNDKINSRKNEIKALISEGNVQSQEELMGLLEMKGYTVTQATLSRDLKELGVAKVYDRHNGYCYRLASYDNNLSQVYKEATPSDGIISIEFCGHLAVIKTMPGFASVVASVVDNNLKTGIAGTIAGDDTVFVALRNADAENVMMTAMEHYLPGIGYKRIKK